MDNNTNKIEILENSIESILRKSKRNMILTAVIYVIIVVFVIIYTTVIGNHIKNTAKPDVVAELLTGTIQSHIPELTANIQDNTNDYANYLAERTVSYFYSFVPFLGDLAKAQLDYSAIAVNAELNSKYLPVINEYFVLNKNEINNMFNQLTDEQIAIQMNKILLEELDKNFTLINTPLAESINDLKTKIDKLANTPNSQLTNKELATKRVIAYWIYLVNYNQLTGFNTDLNMNVEVQ